MQHQLSKTDRTQIKRKSERANYDQAAIFAALDAALFATIAFNDGASTHAIATAIWREDEHLYIHGSNGSRLLQVLQKGAQACISVTHIHALVLARSAFHHSMNYCSVCIYGVFEVVAEDTKSQHMQRFMEHWMPGRWEHTRLPEESELAATVIMRIPITEAVLKSRQGPPKDAAKDMEHPVWAGIVPINLAWQNPQPAEEQKNRDLPGLSVRPLTQRCGIEVTEEKDNTQIR